MIMKAALCLFAAAFVAAAIGTPAHAQNYPWCAFYTGPFQATKFGFSTYQQCMATISGIGGYCQPNTMYVPPGRRTRQQRASPY
jgi:polyisoprenoid-binding protein YceI